MITLRPALPIGTGPAVTTSRREPTHRIMPGDRVRHLDGKREGRCAGILDETCERIIDWEDGRRETLLPGFLERIPSSSLAPKTRAA